jgi:hypothetical protein
MGKEKLDIAAQVPAWFAGLFKFHVLNVEV